MQLKYGFNIEALTAAKARKERWKKVLIYQFINVCLCSDTYGLVIKRVADEARFSISKSNTFTDAPLSDAEGLYTLN